MKFGNFRINLTTLTRAPSISACSVANRCYFIAVATDATPGPAPRRDRCMCIVKVATPGVVFLSFFRLLDFPSRTRRCDRNRAIPLTPSLLIPPARGISISRTRSECVKSAMGFVWVTLARFLKILLFTITTRNSSSSDLHFRVESSSKKLEKKLEVSSTRTCLIFNLI